MKYLCSRISVTTGRLLELANPALKRSSRRFESDARPKPDGGLTYSSAITMQVHVIDATEEDFEYDTFAGWGFNSSPSPEEVVQRRFDDYAKGICEEGP